ncbi:hypothetical protein Bbelb_227750 [Branchiostoma belcheri]|nr:hypothetical protein Bbelb_227750 [Branchiostoma belcheri]
MAGNNGIVSQGVRCADRGTFVRTGDAVFTGQTLVCKNTPFKQDTSCQNLIYLLVYIEGEQQTLDAANTVFHRHPSAARAGRTSPSLRLGPNLESPGKNTRLSDETFSVSHLFAVQGRWGVDTCRAATPAHLPTFLPPVASPG